MKVVGITGKRAAGKSTVAGMLRRLGGTVFDADAVCAQMYASDKQLIAQIGATFEGVVVGGVLGKKALLGHLRSLEDIKKLESIVHPVIWREAIFFLQRATRARKRWVVMDIPLLFEGGYADSCDKIITVQVADFIRNMRMKKNRLPQDQRGLEPLLLENRLHFRIYKNKSDIVLNTGCSLGIMQKKVYKLLQAWEIY